jgi:predicted transcriptional regulator
MTPRRKGRPYARIAITLPPDVLGAADKLARELDRSRSWVVAEAVRQYALNSTERASETIAAARDELLRRELALSPAERLKRAEDLLHLARLAHPRKPRTQIIAFDSAEEFAEWKRASRIRA